MPRILAVDDSSDQLLALELHLRGAGFEVETVEGGLSALRRCEEVDFDLILLDVRMPGLDGFEVSRRLQRGHRTAFTPVIFLSGHLSSETVQPLISAFLSRFPTPAPFCAKHNRVVIGRVAADEASRDAFSLFLADRALGKLVRYDWPGNHRELKLVATNLVVETLLEQLDAAPDAGGRAPAILQLRDRAIDRLLQREAPTRRAPGARGKGGATIPVEIRAQRTFALVSRDVEQQYMRAVYARCDGDLETMARELLGDKGTARQVHLRLNQLGLSVRELRATRQESDA